MKRPERALVKNANKPPKEPKAKVALRAQKPKALPKVVGKAKESGLQQVLKSATNEQVWQIFNKLCEPVKKDKKPVVIRKRE